MLWNWKPAGLKEPRSERNRKDRGHGAHNIRKALPEQRSQTRSKVPGLRRVSHCPAPAHKAPASQLLCLLLNSIAAASDQRQTKEMKENNSPCLPQDSTLSSLAPTHCPCTPSRALHPHQGSLHPPLRPDLNPTSPVLLHFFKAVSHISQSTLELTLQLRYP